MVDLKESTWGCELEFGDVPKYIRIPEGLGKWEYCETDIVNLKSPYKYKAADPLGILVPFGGEINTKPTLGYKGQVEIIKELFNFFKVHGYTPTRSCFAHFHIHIHIPGLIEDIDSLKKIVKYVYQNQDQLIELTSGFEKHEGMTKTKSTSYFKYDGFRKIPLYIVNNILERSTDFDSFIKMFCAGKDGESLGRPFRYLVNMYNLKNINTIEFRCFRGISEYHEAAPCFQLVKSFLENALYEEGLPLEIFKRFKFPKFYFSEEEAIGWQKTKFPKERGKKVRTYEKVKS